MVSRNSQHSQAAGIKMDELCVEVLGPHGAYYKVVFNVETSVGYKTLLSHFMVGRVRGRGRAGGRTGWHGPCNLVDKIQLMVRKCKQNTDMRYIFCIILSTVKLGAFFVTIVVHDCICNYLNARFVDILW